MMRSARPTGRGRLGHAHDHRRGLREGPAAARHRARLRHHRLGVHADLGPLPARRHHLLGLRPRGQRRDDGGRLRSGDRQDGDVHRPERAGHHQLRDPDQDRLLEPHAAAPRDAAGGEPDHRTGRLPGDPADEPLRGHGLLPGRGARPGPHRRGAEPGDREGAPRLGAGADQRAARLLDPRGRHRPAADRSLRASGRRSGGDRPSGGAALGGEVPGHAQRRGRGARPARSRPRSPSRSGFRRRLPATTSTTTPSRARIRSRSDRSATTARRRRWS